MTETFLSAFAQVIIVFLGRWAVIVSSGNIIIGAWEAIWTEVVIIYVEIVTLADAQWSVQGIFNRS